MTATASTPTPATAALRPKRRSLIHISHYELNGEVIDEFPFPTLQSSAKPVMEYMEGWKCDISGVRKWEDLPEAARK